MATTTHAEYVESVRRSAAAVAAQVLAGEADVLESAHALVALLWEAEIDEREPLFLTLRGVSSQIDHLPIGEVRAHWSPSSLEELEPEIQSARTWAAPQVVEVSHWLVQRFGP